MICAPFICQLELLRNIARLMDDDYSTRIQVLLSRLEVTMQVCAKCGLFLAEYGNLFA